MMQKYDIYAAHLRFVLSDGSQFEEVSPVLILDASKLIVLVVKCTSHKACMCNELDYEIQEWKQAGLNKETTIMFDYPLHVEAKDIMYKIGQLQPFDIKWVDDVVEKIIANN